MKLQVFLVLTAVLVLSACQGNSSERGENSTCNEYLCLEYKLSAPIQADIPIGLTVILTSKQDIPQMSFAIEPLKPVEFREFSLGPDRIKPVITNPWSMGWELKAKAGDVNTFTGYLLFPRPTDGRVYEYSVLLAVVGPTMSHQNLLISVYIDKDGNQATREDIMTQGPLLLGEGTVLPVVTLTPGMKYDATATGAAVTQDILSLDTPTPTVTITPTVPGYPAP